MAFQIVVPNQILMGGAQITPAMRTWMEFISRRLAETGGGGGETGGADFVPYYLPSGETFTLPAFKQAEFAVAIDNEGTLDIEGILTWVD